MVAGSVITLAYIFFLVLYGVIKGGRAKSFDDFSGKGTEPALFAMTASMCASFIGGGFSLGNAEQAFSFGITNTLLLAGFSLGQLIVGMFIAPKFADFAGESTAGGIIGKIYGPRAQMLCGLLSALFCTGVLGAQIRAIGTVAGYLFGADPKLCSVIGFGIIIAYSTFGGLKASIKSDVIQIIVLAVGLPLALFAAIIKSDGIPASLFRLPARHLNPMGNYTATGFAGVFLTFTVGELLCPPSSQRMLLSKEPKRIRSATILSGLIALPFFAVTGCIGLYALLLGTTDTPAFAMPSLIHSVLGPTLGAVICAAMLCIYLSSGGSFLNSCASAVSEDVIFIGHGAASDDARRLGFARAINVLCGLAALVVALSFDDVLAILVMSYSFWAPVVLVPLIGAVANKKILFESAFIVPAIVSISALLMWRAVGEPFGVPALIAGLASNFCAFGLCKRRKLNRGNL